MPSSIRFAYSTINWGTTPDLSAAASGIRESGWNALELFWHSLDWLGPVELLQQRLNDLQVATLFGLISVPTDRTQIEKLKNQIAYTWAAGGEIYGLVGGDRLRWRPPSAAEYLDLADACEELAVFGSALGVTVAYHPHVACTIETESEIDRLLDCTQALTLCLDPSHIALVGEDPVEHIRKYRTRTGYHHLKDWGYGKFTEMGRGTIGIDFAAILKELDSATYDGWVVVEQSRSDESPLRSCQNNAEFLRSLGYDPGQVERNR